MHIFDIPFQRLNIRAVGFTEWKGNKKEERINRSSLVKTD